VIVADGDAGVVGGCDPGGDVSAVHHDAGAGDLDLERGQDVLVDALGQHVQRSSLQRERERKLTIISDYFKTVYYLLQNVLLFYY
jgi:hypothetical protein